MNKTNELPKAANGHYPSYFIVLLFQRLRFLSIVFILPNSSDQGKVKNANHFYVLNKSRNRITGLKSYEKLLVILSPDFISLGFMLILYDLLKYYFLETSADFETFI